MSSLIDESQLENFRGDVEFYLEMLELFEQEYAAHFEGLEQAITNGGGKEVHDHAHALKGICLNIGAAQLADTSAAICALTKDSGILDPGAVAELHKQLPMQIEAWRKAIKEYLPNIEA